MVSRSAVDKVVQNKKRGVMKVVGEKIVLGETSKNLFYGDDCRTIRWVDPVMKRTVATCVVDLRGKILDLDVSPEFRGRGIGSDLLQRGIRKLKKEGVEKIELEVDPEEKERTADVINLYKKHGFQPKDYNNPEIMQLIVNEDILQRLDKSIKGRKKAR